MYLYFDRICRASAIQYHCEQPPPSLMMLFIKLVILVHSQQPPPSLMILFIKLVVLVHSPVYSYASSNSFVAYFSNCVRIRGTLVSGVIAGVVVNSDHL